MHRLFEFHARPADPAAARKTPSRAWRSSRPEMLRRLLDFARRCCPRFAASAPPSKGIALVTAERPSVHLRVRGEIEFRNVSFRYTGEGPGILRDISFHVRPGMRVAIVGPEGSGESALINLLTRLHDPSEGTILLDSVELCRYPAAVLRSQFSIVSRQPTIVSASVAANIASPRFCDSPRSPRFSRQQIVRAAMLANAHCFIEALPSGYETPLGYDGFLLSAAEQQQLAIARAFLEDAPVVIFDDACGTLDGATEAPVREALDRLMRGRTTFLIARRLSTLEHCDIALVLQNGSLCAIAGSATDAPASQPPAGGMLPRPFLVPPRLAGGHD